jgi:hypothetical protein
VTGAAPRAALLLLAPTTEAAESFTVGLVGQAWRELADRERLLLFGAFLDPGGERPLTSLLATVRAGIPPGVPVVVVARGDAHTALQLAFLRDSASFDGLVVSSDDGHLGKLLPAVPTLMVAPSDRPPAASPDPSHVHRQAGELTAFLSELVLSERVSDWLPGSGLVPEAGPK